MAFKMDEFRKAREEKADLIDTSEEIIKKNKLESSIASPMIGSEGSKIVGGIKKTERLSMTLPISGTLIELTLSEIVPSECIVHPKNQRVQSLLRIENPKVSSLKDAIFRDKQREPVIARWVDVENKKVLEVLDGSRRRFVCDLLHKENQNILLRAWVGKIPDSDAEYIAKFGNNDREDISPWEKAMALKQIQIENPSWSHEVIAVNEKISRQSVTYLLQISDIPIEIIQMLVSPDLLKITSGIQVLKLVRETKNMNYLKELEKGAPYAKLSDLLNRLKELLRSKKNETKPSMNRKVEIKKGKTLRASIGVNRREPGQFKVDLFKLTDSEYQEILKALENILK